MHDWTIANRKLFAYLRQQRGVNGVPSSYIARIDEDCPEEVDEV
jgi:hypothetical protein